MRFGGFVLMLLAVPAALAQDGGAARQVLDECIESLELAPDVVGIADMEERCPGIGAALDEAGIAPWLSEGQQGLLTRNGLINLRTLQDRYAQPPEREPVNVADLGPVLESLREPPVAERELTWYERFNRWLRDALNRQDVEPDPWLQRWLEEHPIPDAVWAAVRYGVVALLIVLTVLIVGNEIRAVRTGRRKRAAASHGSVDFHGAPTPGVFDLEAALRDGRPSVVLRMLIATLIETGRIHGAHSLTHRELMTRARFDDSAQRDSFRRVTQLAELEVFSGRQLVSDDLNEAVRIGRHLNAQLSGAAA